MTLVLTLVEHNYIAQVSDRQTTIALTGRPHDVLANKGVVYRAQDALVAIAYTGLAFLEGTPTDEWLVEQITGQPILRGPSGQAPATLRIGPLPQSLDVGRAAEVLRTSLDAVFSSSSFSGQPHTVVMAGWHYGRQHVRPVVWEISNLRTPPKFTARWRLDRWWSLKGKAMLFADPAEHLPSRAAYELVQQLQNAQTSTDAEHALVEAIRLISSTNRLVGEDAMSITLPRDFSRTIGVRFVPHTPREFRVWSPRGEIGVRVAYSPWLVGPATIAAPSAMSGFAPRVTLGSQDVVMTAPGNEHFGFMTSQLRRTP